MTARKPKPNPRKASGPTLEQRVAVLEGATQYDGDWLEELNSRLGALEKWAWGYTFTGLRETPLADFREEVSSLRRHLNVLESRDRLRDKSHDEPVSNGSEAIGQHFRIVDEIRAPWWRRFLGFMGAPVPGLHGGAVNAFSASTLTLSMATGSGPLTEPEAQKLAAYLTDQLPATEPQDQHVVLRLIRGLREVPKHEAAFGDLYRMPGALPGWTPDP